MDYGSTSSLIDELTV